MTGISIQFHALPEETLPLMQEYVRQSGLHITAMKFPPPEGRLIGVDDLHEGLLEGGVRRIAFTLEPPVLTEETSNRFFDHNPDALILDPGRLTEKGLEESWLSARTSNEAALKVWKRVARKLRGITKAGAIAINPDTGATAHIRIYRSTAGARDLQAKGVVMRSLGGGSIIQYPL
ncbi:MAG TPA: hypothetical protein VLQ93_14960 [Myxococcaceae bacterium]|nr:hypothetical protein [Myxococcaceae bacterium]